MLVSGSLLLGKDFYWHQRGFFNKSYKSVVVNQHGKFWWLVIHRPIFSADNINSDKHKMERFLHPGRFSVASIYAPISFPPLPLIAMKNVGDASPPVVAAVGSLKSVDPDRIILKKIILTG